MPGYRAHLVGGAVVALAVHYFAPLTTDHAFFAVCLCVCLLGSLFPDIDIKSKGQMVFYKLLALAIAVAIASQEWQTLSVLALLSTVPLMLKHRGATHHPWFITFLAFTIAFLLNSALKIDLQNTALLGFFFGLGAFSHIILDRGVRIVARQLLGR